MSDQNKCTMIPPLAKLMVIATKTKKLCNDGAIFKNFYYFCH